MRKWVWVGVLTVLAVLLCTVKLWGPRVVFDTSQPAYDVNSETRDGKKTAWGPRPAQWLLAADSRRATFRGDEWYFSFFRSYCRKWVEENGYALPPWPIHDK